MRARDATALLLTALLLTEMLWAATGCSSSEGQRAGASVTNAVRIAPLHFEVQQADGAPKVIHTAFVDAVVDGQRIKLILDTGASDHVFTRPTLNFSPQNLIEVDAGTDHAGAAVASWRLRRTASVEVLGLPAFAVQAPLVIAGPPPFLEWDIGGFLAPQQLAAGAGFAVVDFHHRVLRLESAAPTACPKNMSLLQLESVQAEGDAARLPIVNAAFKGAPIRLLLNTGGRHFEIAPDRVDGPRADVEITGKGLSGSAVEGQFGERGILDLMGHPLDIERPLLRPQGASFDAQIGMDALGTTILWLPKTQERPIYLCLDAP